MRHGKDDVLVLIFEIAKHLNSSYIGICVLHRSLESTAIYCPLHKNDRLSAITDEKIILPNWVHYKV